MLQLTWLCFEDLFVNAHQDRYKLVCGLKTSDKLHENSHDSGSTGGGQPLTDDSTIDYLKFLSFRIKFKNIWLKLLEYNCDWSCTDYQDKIRELFINVPTTNPTPMA